jgi:hypothetical protein
MLSNNTLAHKMYMPTKKEEEDVPTGPRFQPAPLKSSDSRTADKRSKRRCLCDECRGMLEVLNEADEKGVYFTIARWREEELMRANFF